MGGFGNLEWRLRMDGLDWVGLDGGGDLNDLNDLDLDSTPFSFV